MDRPARLSPRLLAAFVLPLVGVVLLLVGLAYLGGELAERRVEYRGRTYVEQGTVDSTEGYVPAPELVDGRQVYVPVRQIPGPPPTILLEDAGGAATAYRLVADADAVATVRLPSPGRHPPVATPAVG